MSGYIEQNQDDVEPISDSWGEIASNNNLYNVIWPDGGSCALTPSGANLTVALASGQITHYGITVQVAANATAYTLVVDTTFPRWTWLALSSAGAPVIVSGDPAAVPSVPELGDNVAVALVYVQAGLSLASAATYNLGKRVAAPIYNSFDGVLQEFRQNRRIVGHYSAQANTAAGTASAAGIGMYQTPVDSSDIVSAISTEPVMRFSVATAGTGSLYLGSGGSILVHAPAHSPRMLARVQLPASSANLTSYILGFAQNASVTANGAYIRVVTTGNPNFVTRQGGAETAHDLGTISRTAVLGYIIESPDAGVTWNLYNQAGTLLYSHTTNVPTAATGLISGVVAVTATGAVPWGVAYMRIEGTFS